MTSGEEKIQGGDAERVLRCLAGDSDAYASLVQRYQDAVYATAYYYVGKYGVAEDVAQEAFWSAYRSLRALKDPERFGPWLRGITTRTAANWLRKHLPKMRQETPLPHRRTIPLADVRHGVEAVLNTAEQMERIQDAIDALPERYRLPVVLRYLQELSYEEIARFTGDTPDETRGVLQRAVRQLREILVVTGENVSPEVVVPWRRANK